MLSRIVVSYRNSTSNHNNSSVSRRETYVVSYRNSTSNHNSASDIASATPLYLIEILHQTTTNNHCLYKKDSCILSKFYIKPQHPERLRLGGCCCILSKFYIKPQPTGQSILSHAVVSYRNSTSNHNQDLRTHSRGHVVSYRNSTSNHNHSASR